MKILMVDDEPNILELLKAYLETSGTHQVETATSGVEALAKIEAEDGYYDCLLLDIQMPQMNGLTLCEKVRALPDYGHVPIIMLTAMSHKSYLDKAFSLGATDYLTKPFDFLELNARMNTAQQMAVEHARSLARVDAAHQLFRDLVIDFKPGAEEPFSIDGVKGVVGYSEFETYALELPRTQRLFALAYAVKISDFAEVHATTNATGLRAVVKGVAEVIAESSGGPDDVITYRGNGTFLCISNRKKSISPAKRAALLNQALQTNDAVKVAKSAIRVSTGENFWLLSLSKSGSLFALHRAVASVEGKPLPPRNPSFSGIAGVAGGAAD